MKNLKNEIKNDFLGKTKNRAIELKFLKNISKSKVFISKKTGLVFHNDIRPSIEIVNYWTKKSFKNKMNPKKGYVKGNVVIISFRANQLKSDIEDIEIFNKLYQFYKKYKD